MIGLPQVVLATRQWLVPTCEDIWIPGNCYLRIIDYSGPRSFLHNFTMEGFCRTGISGQQLCIHCKNDGLF